MNILRVMSSTVLSRCLVSKANFSFPATRFKHLSICGIFRSLLFHSKFPRLCHSTNIPPHLHASLPRTLSTRTHQIQLRETQWISLNFNFASVIAMRSHRPCSTDWLANFHYVSTEHQTNWRRSLPRVHAAVWRGLTGVRGQALTLQLNRSTFSLCVCALS